jgi:class 3 adenylate cyclase
VTAAARFFGWLRHALQGRATSAARMRALMRDRMSAQWQRTVRIGDVALSKIGLQLAAAAAFLLVAALAATGGVVLKDQRKILLSEMQSKCDVFVRNLSVVAREAYYPRPDLFFLGYLAEETLKEEWIRGISLFDKSGKQILSRRKDAAAGPDVVPVVRPIFLKDTVVGSVEMVFSTKPVKEAQRRVARRMGWLALGAVGLGLVVIFAGVPFLVRPIFEMAIASEKIGKGNFDVAVTYKANNELGVLAQTFNHMVKGLKERESIRATFGRYFSPQVAEAILEGGVSQGGERLPVTVMFTDIREFTSLSEKLPPEEVVGLLNSFFSAMVKIIHTRQGTVDKFIGDAILAVFGAPIPFENHAFQAVTCAMEMRDALKKLNEDRLAYGQEPLKIGIALNTGDVVAGNLGAYEKSEYTVIGDTVNLASRMESLNKKFNTDLLVSRATWEPVKDWFPFKPLGVHEVRGRKLPVELYTIPVKT